MSAEHFFRIFLCKRCKWFVPVLFIDFIFQFRWYLLNLQKELNPNIWRFWNSSVALDLTNLLLSFKGKNWNSSLLFFATMKHVVQGVSQWFIIGINLTNIYPIWKESWEWYLYHSKNLLKLLVPCQRRVKDWIIGFFKKAFVPSALLVRLDG